MHSLYGSWKHLKRKDPLRLFTSGEKKEPMVRKDSQEKENEIHVHLGKKEKKKIQSMHIE